MLEGSVMEYAKWFIAIVSISFITMAVVFMFKLNGINSFQQEVNYQIERHGGLTQSALKELDEYTKETYGGYLAKSMDDNAGPLFDSDKGLDSSGFFVSEVKTIDGDMYFYPRSDRDEAHYGTPIKYVISRQIGQVNGVSFLKPVVFGKSASRVRGTVDD